MQVTFKIIQQPSNFEKSNVTHLNKASLTLVVWKNDSLK